MKEKTLTSIFLFSLIVTIGMNSLDMMYHLATDTAVHLNYVAVKFTIIFLVVFLIAYLIGIGIEQGIVSSIGGPVIFYIYYRFATPTLDRTIFTLDEAVWYIIVHTVALLVVYFTAYKLQAKKQTSLLAFLVAICVAATEMAIHMFFKTPGLVDELRVFLHVSYPIIVVVSIFAIVSLIFYLTKVGILIEILTPLLAGFGSQLALMLLLGLPFVIVFAITRSVLALLFIKAIR